ncbi:bifunctional hydroxymethylpyrimidine kinase/phosphomethylpyrimidine kinase [Mesorhizobium sp. M0129]|uniref:bifunctional hydroxymethylpyrimidine kinase/phosphomethylpyrimidine kinase n=1 Tax=Mesorhizobium sp. M0129 TaxID=2956886 RepID=UPI00333D232C
MASGGAGLTRDVETIAALGLRSCVAITVVTAQTHQSVEWIEHRPPDLATAQMRAALAANCAKAIKIGMLGTNGAIAKAAAVLRDHPSGRDHAALQRRATTRRRSTNWWRKIALSRTPRRSIAHGLDVSGGAGPGPCLLVRPGADRGSRRRALPGHLMPLCRIVTPNLPELAEMTGSAIAVDEASACRQGEELSRSVSTAVLVKGGHARGNDALDLLVQPDRPPLRFMAPRLPGEMRGDGLHPLQRHCL